LIVDEPTAGLDPEERVRLRNLLGELSGDRIVLLSTHIVSDVEATASRIALIHEGRLVADGPPEALLARVEGRVWELAVRAEHLDDARRAWRVGAALRRGPDVLLRVVADEIPRPDAKAVAPTLEDAYLALVGDERGEHAGART
ncbi:MAG: ABC transporter ATP-binding protein, partial [Candidatus Eisenbacteria bacterium]